MDLNELIVDSFAGGGGASLGITWALGRGPDIAINHDAEALAMHAANHPDTMHVCEDVWHANLRELVGQRPVGLLWLSPDCKHFSRAKGAVPVSKHIRSLAWIAVRWASQVRPRVIMLENVREFADWGPLTPRWSCGCGWHGTEGQATLHRRQRRCPRCESARLRVTAELVPDPAKKGTTFRLFVNRLRGLGYAVQWRSLNAADFGAPTIRKRLFLIARRDGSPIEWPEPTHGSLAAIDGMPLFQRLKPWRTAAECIEWSIPCPSIFGRQRRLADKTMRRIAMGLKRYVLEDAQPFLVPITHSGERRCHPIDEPLPTVTTAHRGEIGLVVAYLAKHFGGVVGVRADTPLPTTTERGSQTQLVTADLRPSGDSPVGRARDVYAFLIRYFGTSIGQHVTEPLYTITGKDRFGLVTVNVDGQTFVIADVGMRMLTARELARAQGFPDTYQLTGSKTNQVAKIGNSVVPQVSAAIVRANLCPDMAASVR